MKTGKNRAEREPVLRLLVLVPHRDARLPLRAWSASLFAAGLHGAWSFPWVAPLAVLSRQLSAEELKRLARALREHVAQNGGKFLCGRPDFSIISRKGGKAQSFLRTSEQGLSVFGPSLQTELPDNFFEGIDDAALSRISPLVIGSAMLGTGDWGLGTGVGVRNIRAHDVSQMNFESQTPIPDPRSLLPLPTFRAAALANMSYRHDANLYEWKIGTLYWLPKTGLYAKSTTTNP